MKVYILQAALICEGCGQEFMIRNPKPDHVDTSDESSYDSDEWPKGPYPDGGGEADCPQHCDHCGVFLDNPLTGDGETYVRDAFGEYVETGRGSLDVLGDWKAAYGWCWDDWTEITLPLLIEDKPLKPAAQARLDELEAL